MNFTGNSSDSEIGFRHVGPGLISALHSVMEVICFGWICLSRVCKRLCRDPRAAVTDLPLGYARKRRSNAGDAVQAARAIKAARRAPFFLGR